VYQGQKVHFLSLSFLDEAQPRFETGQDKGTLNFLGDPTVKTTKQKTSLEKLQIYFVSFSNKYINLLIYFNNFFYSTYLLHLIYGNRTIIRFVGFVANLLHTDGATVSVRKSASEKELLFVRL
jgi:hypothetical protein